MPIKTFVVNQARFDDYNDALASNQGVPLDSFEHLLDELFDNWRAAQTDPPIRINRETPFGTVDANGNVTSLILCVSYSFDAD